MMKRMIVATALAALLSPLTLSAGETYVMRVDGVACPYCAYGIEKILERRDEVESDSVDVQLEEGLVTLQLKDGMQIDDATLAGLLDDAGFTLRSVERQADTTDAADGDGAD
jgi:copper chaperone